MTAREAYENDDVKLSIELHEHPELHKLTQGKYTKPIIFGALDGIITTFALITSGIGADISKTQILILGLAQIFADGFSMGFGEYLSSESERKYYDSEKKREYWECNNYLEGEKQEMIELYKQKGISLEDATLVVNILSKNIDSFVEIMMIEELQLTAVDSQKESIKNGIIMFLSFLFFGFIPLIPYILNDNYYQFMISCILTGFLLFMIGVYSGIISSRNWYITGFKMLLQGSISAGLAFLVSKLAENQINPGS